MLVLIDNYDSFTYNLVQYFGDLGQDVTVYRNDEITVPALLDLKPDGIIISPGPGAPAQAGICLELVKEAAKRGVPLLGICLGHQAIGQAFGGQVVRAPQPMHGKISAIIHEGKGLFSNLPSPYTATRYHSLVVDRDSLPACLEITAKSEDGLIMGLAHREKPICGVQYHPESIASEHGHTLLENFVSMLEMK